MTILIDPAVWPWRGRLWAHLVSDASYDELHTFAERLGVPRRAFQGDHYDVPADVRKVALALGAEPVSARELLRRLTAAGLRRPRRPGPVRLRVAGAGDAEFLTQMLAEAVNWRAGDAAVGRRLEQVLALPELARYVAGWPRPGDHGVVADTARQPVGAGWLRLLSADEPGYGFVAADVPELSLAVRADYRGRGIGRLLLRRLLADARRAGVGRVSLSVERDNPARALYLSEGFQPVAAGPGSDTMVVGLAPGVSAVQLAGMPAAERGRGPAQPGEEE